MKKTDESRIGTISRMKERFRTTHLPHFRNRAYWLSVVSGIALLSGALVLNFFAGRYASASESNSVTDIVLSHTRTYAVEGIFTYGALLLVTYVAVLCTWYPGKAPFVLKSIALFVLVRSVSMSLTHIGPFPSRAEVSLSDFLQNFIFTGDLFFSGHTGLPFLMGLVFWKNEPLRWFSMAASAFFGAVVLLGHLHYSIDVFAAFFITYSIFKISEKIFRRDSFD